MSAMYLSTLLILSRIARRWNQSGQKHAGASAITNLLHSHPGILWSLIPATLGKVGIEIVSYGNTHSFPDIVILLAASATVMLIFLFKLSFTAKDAPEHLASSLRLIILENTTFLARAALLSTATLIFLVALGRRLYLPSSPSTGTSLLGVLVLLLVIQTRLSNIPLLTISLLQYLQLANLNLTPIETTVSILLLAYASFFSAGGTNAISSLDLSNAYNGISDYSAPLVGVQLFVSNWAGPILWSFAGLALLRLSGTPATGAATITTNTTTKSAKAGETWRRWRAHMALLTLFEAVAILGVMGACTALRAHLFVWTVFSPKYLYAAAWSLGWHVGVNGVLGGLVTFLGTI